MVDAIARAFGQEGRQLKETPEALYLRTPDGLLYAFFEDPSKLTTALVKRLLDSGSSDLSRLVVLALLPLEPASVKALEEAGASVVAGERFHRLLEGLELNGFVEGSTVRSSAGAAGEERRVLPTAERLDQTMERARLWMGWGVPAIALRFFEEATRLKPEFAPAWVGRGSALLALGATEEAEHAFEEALGHAPGNEEARVGLARVTGVRGDPQGELDELKSLLKGEGPHDKVRAHLLAAMVEQGRWKEAVPHVEYFLEIAPQEPYFHALSSAFAERMGDKEGAARERRAADALGIKPEEWNALREQLSGRSTSRRRPGMSSSTSSSRSKSSSSR